MCVHMWQARMRACMRTFMLVFVNHEQGRHLTTHAIERDVHISSCVCVCVCVRVCVCAHTHTKAHRHTNTQTHIRINVHERSQTCKRSSKLIKRGLGTRMPYTVNARSKPQPQESDADEHSAMAVATHFQSLALLEGLSHAHEDKAWQGRGVSGLVCVCVSVCLCVGARLYAQQRVCVYVCKSQRIASSGLLRKQKNADTDVAVFP